MKKFGLYSSRVLIADQLNEGTVIVKNGQIDEFVAGPPQKGDSSITDLGDCVIMPGLIDCHVHINEPGRAEWEGFDTATKAAAAGGITTLIEMPLNSDPVTTTRKSFDEKLVATTGKLHVNCGFWGGIIPQNITDLDDLLKSGVFGIKAFLTHSGIDEFPNVTENDLRQGLPILKENNVPLLVHAEIDASHDGQRLLRENPTSYQAYLASRPKSWEDDAIRMLIQLCEEYDTPIHIVHLSSSNSIHQLDEAKRAGLPLSVETCPHYLFFNAEEIEDGNTSFKCAPPIRERENNEQLWQAVKNGLFSFIVSDHSPAVPEIKELESGNLEKAWGGVPGLQFSMPAFWTKARDQGFSISDVSRLMSTNVAEFLGIGHQKGKIANGYDADLIVWDPEHSFEVTSEIINFRHKISPYIGRRLKGVVRQTYVGGDKVFENGTFYELSKGKVLLRNE